MSYNSGKSYSSSNFQNTASIKTKAIARFELIEKLEQYADDPIMVKIIAQQLRSI